MDKLLSSVQDYIKSGEYFTDARSWYNSTYMYPLIQRSVVLLLTVIILVLFIVLAITTNNLLPIDRQVRYAIAAKSLKNATIIPADHISKDPISSIADIMIKNYVIHRESYDYDLLAPQFNFVQNNSTRIIFIQFANYMNIDNPLSPVMRYQRNLRRSVNVVLVKYKANNEADVIFTSLVKNISNEILENMVWQATISFEIDPIDIYIPANSRFNFAITSYKLKLIEDKNNK
ncbi:MAG: VirB8/TrbF family protein [Candidatus Rickettsia vulgarisii]